MRLRPVAVTVRVVVRVRHVVGVRAICVRVVVPRVVAVLVSVMMGSIVLGVVGMAALGMMVMEVLVGDLVMVFVGVAVSGLMGNQIEVGLHPGEGGREDRERAEERNQQHSRPTCSGAHPYLSSERLAYLSTQRSGTGADSYPGGFYLPTLIPVIRLGNPS